MMMMIQRHWLCSGLKFNSILRGLVAFELSDRERTSCLAELVWIFMVSAAECVSCINSACFSWQPHRRHWMNIVTINWILLVYSSSERWWLLVISLRKKLILSIIMQEFLATTGKQMWTEYIIGAAILDKSRCYDINIRWADHLKSLVPQQFSTILNCSLCKDERRRSSPSWDTE